MKLNKFKKKDELKVGDKFKTESGEICKILCVDFDGNKKEYYCKIIKGEFEGRTRLLYADYVDEIIYDEKSLEEQGSKDDDLND